MLSGVPSIEGQQIKYNIQGNTKTSPARDCEMENILMFFKIIEIFKELWTKYK